MNIDPRLAEKLTPRQIDCLCRYAARKTAKQIGRELGITHHAVEKHLAAVRQKLGVETTAQAVDLLSGNATVEPYYHPQGLPHDHPPAPSSGPAEGADDGQPELSLLRDVASEGGPYRYDLSPKLIAVAIATLMVAVATVVVLMILAGQGSNDIALPIWRRFHWIH
ncbi:MAG: helix-turn-helix transcriptional regulator [Sphingomonas sp.]